MERGNRLQRVGPSIGLGREAAAKQQSGRSPDKARPDRRSQACGSRDGTPAPRWRLSYLCSWGNRLWREFV
jgi:hypothetical protein